MIFCSNFQFKLMFFVAAKHRRCKFLQVKRSFLQWECRCHEVLALILVPAMKIEIRDCFIWWVLQMFLNLVVLITAASRLKGRCTFHLQLSTDWRRLYIYLELWIIRVYLCKPSLAVYVILLISTQEKLRNNLMFARGSGVCVRCVSWEKHRHQSFIKMHEAFLPHQNQNSLIPVFSIYTQSIKGRKYILIRIRFLFRIFKSSMNKIAIYIEIRIIKPTRIYKSCQALDKYLLIPLSIPGATDIYCLSVFRFFVSMLTVRAKSLR